MAAGFHVLELISPGGVYASVSREMVTRRRIPVPREPRPTRQSLEQQTLVNDHLYDLVSDLRDRMSKAGI